MAKSGPDPFTPEIVAMTILEFLKVKPTDQIACEHGCKHSAKDFVQGHLEQMLKHAR